MIFMTLSFHDKGAAHHSGTLYDSLRTIIFRDRKRIQLYYICCKIRFESFVLELRTVIYVSQFMLEYSLVRIPVGQT